MSDEQVAFGLLRDETEKIERWVLSRPYLYAGYVFGEIAHVIDYSSDGGHFAEIVMGGIIVRCVDRQHLGDHGHAEGVKYSLTLRESRAMSSGRHVNDDIELVMELAVAQAVAAALRSKIDGHEGSDA